MSIKFVLYEADVGRQSGAVSELKTQDCHRIRTVNLLALHSNEGGHITVESSQNAQELHFCSVHFHARRRGHITDQAKVSLTLPCPE